MRVGLTFDAEFGDRPDARLGHAEAILNILATRGVKASFFVQGRWAQAYPDLVRRMADDGHTIGNHSFYHAPLPFFTRGGLVIDVIKAEQALRAITGRSAMPWFRPPFGNSALLPEGWTEVLWDVAAKDWTAAGIGEVCRNVTSQVRDGSIVLFHTWPLVTPPALNSILDHLDATYVGIEDLPCPGDCIICGEDIPCALPRFHDGDCTAVRG